MTRRSHRSAFGGPRAAAEITEAQDLSSFGIKADGVTDDTASIQKAMDAAPKAGGSVVLPASQYRVAGNLKIPPGVGLEGVHSGTSEVHPQSVDLSVTRNALYPIH